MSGGIISHIFNFQSTTQKPLSSRVLAKHQRLFQIASAGLCKPPILKYLRQGFSCQGFQSCLKCWSTVGLSGSSWTETTSSSTPRPGTGWSDRTSTTAPAVFTPRICSWRESLWEVGNMPKEDGTLLQVLSVFGCRILWSRWTVRSTWETDLKTFAGELTELVTLLQMWCWSESIF